MCVDFALPLRNRMEHRCTVTKFFLLLPQGAFTLTMLLVSKHTKMLSRRSRD